MHVRIVDHYRGLPVGFIKDYEGDTSEVGVPLLQVVNKPPRGGYDDIHPGSQLVLLLVHLSPANDNGCPEPACPAESLHLLFYLLSQLAGRGQDESNWSIPRSVWWLIEAVLDHRDREGGGLARAGFSTAENIPSAESQGDALSLDRRWCCVLVMFDICYNVCIKILWEGAERGSQAKAIIVPWS